MLQINMQSSVPIYEQIIKNIKELVAVGVFQQDDQLPSVRSLAKEININPNTVQKAYQELERQGVIYSVFGKGNFISNIENAVISLRSEIADKLKQNINEAKQCGILKVEIMDMVEFAYTKGEQDHDQVH